MVPVPYSHAPCINYVLLSDYKIATYARRFSLHYESQWSENIIRNQALNMESYNVSFKNHGLRKCTLLLPRP